MEAENFRETLKLLRDLADLQNGPPLETVRNEWEETMQEVWEFLYKWEIQNQTITMDKEQKAREYASSIKTSDPCDNRFAEIDFKAGFEEGYKLAEKDYSSFQDKETYDAGFEAGKQERDRLIADLRNKLRPLFNLPKLYLSDKNLPVRLLTAEAMQARSNAELIRDILENLSK